VYVVLHAAAEQATKEIRMTSAYTSSGEHYHLVGVAGVGMSALAQVLLGQGMRVSGSDRHFDRGEDLEVIAKLRGAGVRFLPQDGRGVTAGTAGVVVSTAIEKGNPDLEAAECRAVPVMHRAEMLARAAAGKRCVAVTGTSGKSTVTGMIGWILDQAGADPVVVNGAPVLNWVTPAAVGNVRLGKSDLWVLEADESDRSLLRYHPD
jgi:UDP-N-acetylmuramate--alanine ligase